MRATSRCRKNLFGAKAYGALSIKLAIAKGHMPHAAHGGTYLHRVEPICTPCSVRWNLSVQHDLLCLGAMGESTLRIVQSDGGVLTFTAQRRLLKCRVLEFRAAGMVNARFYIDGELFPDDEVAMGRTPPPANAPAAPIEDDIVDAEVVPPEPRAPQPSPPMDTRQLYEEAARAMQLANAFLENSAALSNKQAAEMARLQTQQVRDALETGAALQGFVGKLNADLAEERLAAFQIRRNEELIREQDSRRRYEQARAIADANRPSTGLLLLELANNFAANFARNAAQNYTVMNGSPAPAPAPAPAPSKKG